MARRGGSLNFLASETIDILPDCIDMHLVVIDMRHLKSASLTNLESSFRIILEFQYVETLGSWLEFYNALLCMDLEGSITISAVVVHPEFAPQAVERKDIGNAAGVEVNRRVAKIGLPRGGHGATVAMDLNGVLGRVNVLDVHRVSK